MKINNIKMNLNLNNVIYINTLVYINPITYSYIDPATDIYHF